MEVAEVWWERGMLGDVLMLNTISIYRIKEYYIFMCLLQIQLLNLMAYGMALGGDWIISALLMSGINGFPQCLAHLTYLLL